MNSSGETMLIMGFNAIYVGIAAAVALLIVVFIIMAILAMMKQKTIIAEIFDAEPGNKKANREKGFYMAEEPGTFGKEKKGFVFDEDDDVDINAFMVTDSDKEKSSRGSQVVEYRDEETQVKEFNEIAGSMLEHQQTGGATAKANVPPVPFDEEPPAPDTPPDDDLPPPV